MEKNNIIVGAGIAGLGASYSLRNRGIKSIILEKELYYGGLCSGFIVNGFTFDRFVHLSFSNIDEVNTLFNTYGSDVLRHVPNPSNIYRGHWIKHPAQNNLFALDETERELAVNDFLKRPIGNICASNYEEWLRWQYGNYFAEHFPMAYTRKYWMHEARDLRTEWIGKRLYRPSLEEVIAGSKNEDPIQRYYAREMRYPLKGGYSTFLNTLVKEANIRYNTEVKEIDITAKIIKDQNGHEYHYDRLISSMPLPVIVNVINTVPEEIKNATSKLEYTSGYHISIALKTTNIPPYLWWYIYDEDILAARVYSPSLKSPNNAPEGCSSLQMEVYCKEGKYTQEQLFAGTVGKLTELNIIKEEDILFTHIGFEKYANVIFTEPIYEARKIVRDYLLSVGIETIGRFGEWDYLWSDQSLMSGLNI